MIAPSDFIHGLNLQEAEHPLRDDGSSATSIKQMEFRVVCFTIVPWRTSWTLYDTFFFLKLYLQENVNEPCFFLILQTHELQGKCLGDCSC